MKEKQTRSILASGLLAIGCLLWGCTAVTVEDIGAEDARLVTLSFTHPDLGLPTGKTRAGDPESLPAGATVRIAAYYLRKGTDGSMQPASFDTSPPTYEAAYEVQADGSLSPCLVDDDGKKTADTGPGLKVRGGTYDFYAVSPARKLQSPVSAPYNNYHIAGIPHKEDVMTSFQRSVAVSASSNTVALNTFARKCALVVFNVAPSPDNALPFDRLYGTSLILKKISTSGAGLIAGADTGIPLTGGSAGAASELTFSGDDFEPVSGPNPTGLNKAKGVVLPKNNAAFDVSLTVVRDDEMATLNATIDKRITFDPGKRYIFTLEVKNNESSLLMTVQNWTAISFTDPGVGSPDPNRPTDPDIDTGTGTTITIARWDNMPWTGNGEVGKSPVVVRINDGTLKGYYKRMKASGSGNTWTQFRPFDADGFNTAASHGLSNIVLSDTPSMIGSYRIQVQRIQRPNSLGHSMHRDYCNSLTEDGFDNWRLPTMIELFGMWDKAKGTNMNAADNESDSKIFGAPFQYGYYWSSSVYNANSFRCMVDFRNGYLQYSDRSYGRYVRCVRDIN